MQDDKVRGPCLLPSRKLYQYSSPSALESLGSAAIACGKRKRVDTCARYEMAVREPTPALRFRGAFRLQGFAGNFGEFSVRLPQAGEHFRARKELTALRFCFYRGSRETKSEAHAHALQYLSIGLDAIKTSYGRTHAVLHATTRAKGQLPPL